MAQKQLSILIKAENAASAPIRAITRDAAGMATGIEQAAAKSTRAMEKTTGAAQKLKTAIAALALGAAGGFVGAAVAGAGTLLSVRGLLGGEATGELDALSKASRRLGETVENLSRLRYAAKLSNADFETLARTLATTEKVLGQFIKTGKGTQGSAEAIRALLDAGLRLQDEGGRNRTAVNLLPDIADILQKFDTGQRQFVAQKLFGDGAQSILSVIENGARGIRELYAEADRVGAVFSTRQALLAEEYADSITRVEEAWLGVKVAIAQEVQPTAIEFLQFLTARLKELPDQVRLISQLVRQLFSPDEADRAYAEGRLKEILSGAGELIKVGAKEYGLLAGEILVGSIKLAIARQSEGLLDPLFRQSAILREFVSERGQAEDALVAARTRLAALQDRPMQRQIYNAGSTGRLGSLDRAPLLQFADIASAGEKSAIAAAEAEVQKLAVALDEIRSKTSAAASQEARAFFQTIEERSASAGKSMAEAFTSFRQSTLRRGGDPAAPDLGLGQGGIDGPGVTDGLLGLRRGDWQRWAERSAEFYRTFFTAAAGAYVRERDAVLKRVANERTEFQAQLLDLRGDKQGAARIRLQAEIEAQRQAIANGPLYSRENLAVFNQVADLKLRDFEVTIKLVAAEKQLSDAVTAYNEDISRRADLVQAGTLEEFQATRQNQQSAETLRQQAAAVREVIDALSAKEPGLQSDRIAEIAQRIEQATRLAGSTTDQPGVGFGDGLDRGFDRWLERAQEFGRQGEESATQVAEAFSGNLGDAIYNSIADIDNLDDAWQSFARNTISAIGRVATQMLALRLITGAIGAFSGGGGREALATDVGPLRANGLFAMGGVFRYGRVVPFATGGVVGSPTFFPMAGGRTGLMGERGPEAIMPLVRGRGGRLGVVAEGGGGISVTVNVHGGPNGMSRDEFVEVIRGMPRRVVEEIRRSPNLRAEFKGGLS